MKKALFLISLLAGAFVLINCQPHQSAEQPGSSAVRPGSQKIKDWAGTYRGFLPCADCPAIITTLTITNNLGYTLSTQYMDRSDTPTVYSGKFTWNKEGTVIMLDEASKTSLNKFLIAKDALYQFGGNVLYQLDKDGNKFSGDIAKRFTLTTANYMITGKNWGLIELGGKPVMTDNSLPKQAFLMFNENGRFSGSGSCNNLTGSYDLSGINTIKFSQIASTQMACAHMDLESRFLKMLQMADNFYVRNDTLILNKAKMAPLARFRVVYKN